MNYFYRGSNRRGNGNKYHNKKIIVDGVEFDSKKEAERWTELTLLQRAGEIRDLCRQVRYQLVPPQKDEHGKLIEKAVDYIADFQYRNKNDKLVVEDVKGSKQGSAYAIFVIKRKLMLKEYGIRIREV